MAYTYLEFEKPISDLENKIEKLRGSGNTGSDIDSEIIKLSSKIIYFGYSACSRIGSGYL